MAPTKPTRVLMHVVVAVGALFMMLPFFWMLSAAVKRREDIFVLPPVWIPQDILWGNFVEVWTRVPMAQAYVNSLKIAGTVTVFTLLTSSLAAYAFAKIEFPGKRISFATLMATIMIPSQATLIPVYILMSRLGWIDTHWPLIVPPALTNAFGVFLLRQFFMGVPDDLIDAARIDGANPFQIYLRVAIPIVRPRADDLGHLHFPRQLECLSHAADLYQFGRTVDGALADFELPRRLRRRDGVGLADGG